MNEEFCFKPFQIKFCRTIRSISIIMKSIVTFISSVLCHGKKIFLRSLFLRILLNRFYLSWVDFLVFHKQDNTEIQSLQGDPFLFGSYEPCLFWMRAITSLHNCIHYQTLHFFYCCIFPPSLCSAIHWHKLGKEVIRFPLAPLTCSVSCECHYLS